MSRSFTSFEHSTIAVDDETLTESDFNALVKYNDLHKGKYFRVGHKKITFKSYVGVIQTGNLLIEILPKADRDSEDADAGKWQNALLVMLKSAGFIRLNKSNDSLQDVARTALMDIYLYAFLSDVEAIVHAGLVKKYRRTEGNRTSLTGRLIFGKQLQFNSIHKERFYTEHTTYDIDNILNRVLKAALSIVRDISLNTQIRHQASRLLLLFEEVTFYEPGEEDFKRIFYDRKTSGYRHAIELARMIICNYCPNFSSGRQYVLALLFDMNVLFERFMYRMLKDKEDDFGAYGLSVTAQDSRAFWEERSIRPDILLSFRRAGDVSGTTTIVIDTKWKIVDEGSPSDADLKQMFAYNMQFKADHGILLYPWVGQRNRGKRRYADGLRYFDFSHFCELYFIDIFDGAKINGKFAEVFLEQLIL